MALDYGKSDGITEGTSLVKEVDVLDGSWNSHFLINATGTLYFVAQDGATGYELWKSDGSVTGTVLGKDIIVRTQSTYPKNLINVGGTLFFTAEQSATGLELWKSDGTTAGTNGPVRCRVGYRGDSLRRRYPPCLVPTYSRKL